MGKQEREGAKEQYKKGAAESLEQAKEGMKGLGFGDVIPILKAAGRVTRLAWKGDGMSIKVQDYEITSVFDDGVTEMWQPTTEDLFANDWQEVT